MTTPVKFIEPTGRFIADLGDLTIEKHQEITPQFLDHVADARHASDAPAGDFHLAASVPAIVHEKWLREGFDCTSAPIRETLKRLRAEDLHAFIATNKVL